MVRAESTFATPADFIGYHHVQVEINPDERLKNCPRESLERALFNVLGTSAWKVLAKL